MRVPATPNFLAKTGELTRFVHGWTRRRTRKKALRRAYLEYRATHAHQELRFDRHFLTGRGAEALAGREPEALARAWTTQFRYGDEKRREADQERRRLQEQRERRIPAVLRLRKPGHDG